MKSDRDPAVGGTLAETCVMTAIKVVKLGSPV